MLTKKLLSAVISLIISVFTIPLFAQTPKNIIVMISDGCGYNHIEAANLYQLGKPKGQLYESWPVTLAMSTYSIDGKYDPGTADDLNKVKKGYTDSAAAATAMSTGHKTYNGAIGVDKQKNNLKNVIEVAESKGMSTGVVTTVQFSHATPAAFVAHNTSRNNYTQISSEMINKSACEVIMGCGHPYFDNDSKIASERDFRYVGGHQTWLDLIQAKAGADCDNDNIADPWTFIHTRKDVKKLAAGQTPKRVLVIPQARKTLRQRRTGDPKASPFKVKSSKTLPTLPEMTAAAINVLDNNPKGFFLMIEAGAVDWASHANQAGRMIEEQIDFNKAVETVNDWVNKKSSWHDTLVIVTADHECGCLTGPKKTPLSRPVNSGKNSTPQMKWCSDSHTNQLVPFFAKGKGAEIFLKKAQKNDPVRGKYIDNTHIGSVTINLIQSDEIEKLLTL